MTFAFLVFFFFIGDCCLSCALLTFEQQIIFWLIVGLTLDVIIHLSFGYLLVVKKIASQ